jgi:uncharacterized membrane protein
MAFVLTISAIVAVVLTVVAVLGVLIDGTAEPTRHDRRD